MEIILGSKSPGRKKMLEEIGLSFKIEISDIDEKAIRMDDPKKLVLALARAKADAIRKRIKDDAILITSDQVVLWQGKIREKPENENEAREFLEGYNEFPAETITSVVATNIKTGKFAEAVDIAKVYLNPFSQDEINDLIKEGQVFHLAGGFTIDGEKWKKHIKKIDGTRDSVIGLPKDITKRLINEVS